MRESAHIPDEDLDPSAVDLTPYKGVDDQDGWLRGRLTAEEIAENPAIAFIGLQIEQTDDEVEIETLTRLRDSLRRVAGH